MDSPALNHLLRTLAAVGPGQRVLVRGATGDGHVTGPLAQMGFEVHAAPWRDETARQVQGAVENVAANAERDTGERPAPVYATAAPMRALPYPEAHFGWIVALAPRPEEASAGELQELLRALLEEARHHLRPGGWVFVAAPSAPAAFAPEALDEAADRAALAQAEAPEQEARHVRAIYRRVEEHTPP